VENILFKDRQIKLVENGNAFDIYASVALGRGLAALYRGGKWCVVHLRSGQVLQYTAFDSQERTQHYIAAIINILDWRNTYEALLAFLDRDNIKAALIKATQEAWAKEVAA
jgi:hypothetical protein